MKLLVCGSRDWNDYKLTRITLLGMLHSYKTLEIIEGCARGADSLGERFAKEFSLELHHFPAAWRDHTDGSYCTGRCTGDTCYGAGPRRNEEMLSVGRPNAVLVLKDGLFRSSGGGTEDMARRAWAADLEVMCVSHGRDPSRQAALFPNSP